MKYLYSNISMTLNNIIDINSSQDTSINNILTTLPSYLQSETASATYATISNLNLKANLTNPTFSGILAAPTVNATSILQINGMSTNTLYALKPWVQCVINGTNLTFASNSNVGRVTPTVTRTSGQAAGAYDISFTTHPNASSYAHCIQVRTDSSFGFGVISNVFGNSCKIRLYNASQVLTDYQFSLTIFG